MNSWLLPDREEKFRRVAACRQGNLTVVLENVHDIHNVAAVIRSCDAVGIKEIYVLSSDPKLQKNKIKIGTNASIGARRWVDVHYFHEWTPCKEKIREHYELILCSACNKEAKSIYQLDLTKSVALVFGNEHQGITSELLDDADGRFWIPQVGMTQSLNISVACAVTLYESFRQRKKKGYYDKNPILTAEEQNALYEEYQRRHIYKEKNKHMKKEQ